MKVERSYEIVGLTRRGTLVIRAAGGDPSDTGETPVEWVGDASELRRGGHFDYFGPREREILLRGFPKNGRTKEWRRRRS